MDLPPSRFFWVICQVAQVSTTGYVKIQLWLGEGLRQNQQVTLTSQTARVFLPPHHFYDLRAGSLISRLNYFNSLLSGLTLPFT